MKKTSENFKYLFITPLFKLFKNKDKPYVTRGDIEQIVKKINAQIIKKSQNPKQKHSVYLDREHLRIVNTLMKEFASSPSITKHTMMIKVDEILRQSNLEYYNQHRLKAFSNHFHYSGAWAWNNPELNIYDLAFHTRGLKHYAAAHHKAKGPAGDFSGDIFYMRCEDQLASDNILIGNMQIDVNPKHINNPTDGQLAMLNPKNLHLVMVQEAVKHALGRGKKNIMFHTAETMQVAQFGAIQISEEVVTKENYPEMLKNYQGEIDHFTNVSYMDEITNNDMMFKFDGGVVYERAENYYKIAPIIDYMFETINPPDGAKFNRDSKLSTLAASLRSGDFKTFLSNFHLMIAHSCNYPRPLSAVDKKLRFLKDLRRANETEFVCNVVDIIEKYSIKFYDKIYKRQLPPGIKIMEKSGKGKNIRYYVNLNDKNCAVVNKKDIITPVIGKKYPVAVEAVEKPLCPYRHLSTKYNIYKWYNKKLPGTLKKLGFSFEKISLTSLDEKNTVPVFQITGGLEEFKSNPQRFFSSNHEIKKDIEALPQLYAAAAKFGLAAEKLSIINQLISMNDDEKFAGVYDKPSDHITLARGSLSSLAHEGLHRLHSKNLIPQREYKALIKAGKRLAQDYKKRDEILRKDSAGRDIYPKGPRRNQEYAALFVEAYYENNKLARKNLMNEKINACEKILNYFQAATDIVKAHFGNDSAMARSFLRRVEKNQIISKNNKKTKHLSAIESTAYC